MINDPKWQVLWNFLWEWADLQTSPTITEDEFREKHKGELEKAGIWGVRNATGPRRTLNVPKKTTPTHTTPKINTPTHDTPMIPEQPRQNLALTAATERGPNAAPTNNRSISPTVAPTLPGPSDKAPNTSAQPSGVAQKRMYVGKPPRGFEAVPGQEEDELEDDEEEPDPEPTVGEKRKRKDDVPKKSKKAKAGTKNVGDEMEVDRRGSPQPAAEPRDTKRGRVAPTLMGLVFRTPCSRCLKLDLPVRCRVKASRGKNRGEPGAKGACVNCNMAKVKCGGHSLGTVDACPVPEAERLAYEAAFAHWAASEEANKAKAEVKADQEKVPANEKGVKEAKPGEKAAPKQKATTIAAEASRPPPSKTRAPQNTDDTPRPRAPTTSTPKPPKNVGNGSDDSVVIVSMPKQRK